ncbi:MAG: EamA family transporter RarD [Candidatus Pacebacteria bacterium]|nr:EamA family transporter RarD [Candidatus Paceibacterota bacterium]
MLRKLSASVNRGATYGKGLEYALFAFVIWGINPLYFKLFGGLPPILVVAHRTVWLLVMMVIGAMILKRTHLVTAALKNPRVAIALLGSGILLTINWLVSFYAIESNRVLDSSFAYFISPLVAVLFGVVFLRETLRHWQWVGVGLAVCGLLVTLFGAGLQHISWIPFALAATWGLYGVIRKTTDVDSYSGFLIETLFIAPFGLIWVIISETHPEIPHLSNQTPLVIALVLNAGTITILPMLAYGKALRMLPLAQMGILNYLSPLIQFLVAISFFGERLEQHRFIAFCLVWVALVLFTWDGYRNRSGKIAAE